MKVVRRSQNLLILKERSVITWVMGIVFIPVGILIIANSIQNQNDQLRKIVAGGVFAVGGLLMICFAPFATYRFDKNLGNLIIKQKGLLGTKVIKKPLDEIQDVQVEKKISSDMHNNYRVTIVLISGERLPLTRYYDLGKKSKQKAAESIKSFLNINH